MSFFARYWSTLFIGSLKSAHPLLLAGIPLIWAVIDLPKARIHPLYPLFGAVMGILVFLLFDAILSVFICAKNYKVYSVLDKYGFSLEYLRTFERERIIGKPFNIAYAVEYAEIFEHIGQPADAIKYLNTLTVPESANPSVKVSYFYVYVTSALRIGNLNIAEDMWERSMPMIQKVQSNFGYSVSSYLLYLALVMIDLYAAKVTGSSERLQRAYDQTVSFMNSANHKRYPIKECSFEIVLLYELKAMGRTDEFNAFLPKVKEKVENFKPLFTGIKNLTVDSFNKAVNGELPI